MLFLLPLLISQAFATISPTPDQDGSLYGVKGSIDKWYCEDTFDNLTWESKPFFSARHFGHVLKVLERHLEADGWTIIGEMDVPIEQTDPRLVKSQIRYVIESESGVNHKTIDVFDLYQVEKDKFLGGFVFITLDRPRCAEEW